MLNEALREVELRAEDSRMAGSSHLPRSCQNGTGRASGAHSCTLFCHCHPAVEIPCCPNLVAVTFSSSPGVHPQQSCQPKALPACRELEMVVGQILPRRSPKTATSKAACDPRFARGSHRLRTGRTGTGKASGTLSTTLRHCHPAAAARGGLRFRAGPRQGRTSRRCP